MSVPDVDGDGIKDVVVTHGGNQSKEPEVRTQCLVMILENDRTKFATDLLLVCVNLLPEFSRDSDFVPCYPCPYEVGVG